MLEESTFGGEIRTGVAQCQTTERIVAPHQDRHLIHS
jgi:hypothetical protein